MLRIFIVATFLIFISIPCRAVTVTFDSIPAGIPSSETSYTENGVTVTSGGADFGYSSTPGQVHLDDFGTSFTSSITITAENQQQRFSAESVDLFIPGGGPLLSYEMLDPDNPENLSGGTYPPDNILVRGYRNNTLVAESRASTHELSTLHFNNDFTNLDSLEITAEVDFDGAEADLAAAYPELTLVDLNCGNSAPCAHFNVDNLVLDLQERHCIKLPWWRQLICWWS